MHPSKRNVSIASNVSITSTATSNDVDQKKKKKTKSILKYISKPRPEMAMGIWLSWVLLFTLFYIVLWADPEYTKFYSTRSDRAILIVVGAMELIFLAAWVRLAFICPSDPGTILTHEIDLKNMLDSASRAEPPDVTSKYCRSCLVTKPMRSKHCSQCGVCVARMDHHCAWINRCVGSGNHRLFFVFLFLHCFILADFVALSVLTMARIVTTRYKERVDSDSYAGMTAEDVWMELPNLFGDYFLVTMVFIWACCALVALGMMFKQHLVNISDNLTINEQINWRRYAYLVGRPDPSTTNGKPAGLVLKNPFDRGVWNNWLEFFTRSGAHAVDYHSVFTAPSLDRANSTVDPVSQKKKQLQASSREVTSADMV